MFEGALMPTHWLVILVIVLIVFGAGKLPNVMGDIGRGVKEFKKAQTEPDQAPSMPAAANTTLPVNTTSASVAPATPAQSAVLASAQRPAEPSARA